MNDACNRRRRRLRIRKIAAVNVSEKGVDEGVCVPYMRGDSVITRDNITVDRVTVILFYTQAEHYFPPRNFTEQYSSLVFTPIDLRDSRPLAGAVCNNFYYLLTLKYKLFSMFNICNAPKVVQINIKAHITVKPIRASPISESKMIKVKCCATRECYIYSRIIPMVGDARRFL
ncbi:hypothetical protein AGLY_000638 [Aphis glycines]|uniref:Uncharacterized protein n=1 Tax=Aphis glycines TaxID=307491 RepID=A0A6G0U7I9_APHGL|nr:hypothetical protein AGLY_000638 [Aphis glycines]